MTRILHEGSNDILMTPLAGLKFYSNALEDTTGLPLTFLRQAMDDYIAWAESMDGTPTTEVDVFKALEVCLGVSIIEEYWYPDYHDRYGVWTTNLPGLLGATA